MKRERKEVPFANGFESNVKHRMLENIEFFHYAKKFVGQTFLVFSENPKGAMDLVFDFYLFNQTEINLALVCRREENEGKGTLERRNHVGLEFEFRNLPAAEENLPGFASGTLPVFLVGNEAESRLQRLEIAYRLGLKLKARKIFFMDLFEEEMLRLDGDFRNEVNLEEMETAVERKAESNLKEEELFFFLRVLRNSDIECVLLKQEEGALYKEVFSHLGYGTILSKGYRKVVRKGTPQDVLPILFMTRLYETENIILPMDVNRLSKQISDSFVYLVDDSVVAFAMLRDYGEEAELAKFCTQPRYQGKGKARELALKLIEEAERRNYKRVFALSILESMGAFFRGLGFSEVERASLPDSWVEQYDMRRPSKAFALPLPRSRF